MPRTVTIKGPEIRESMAEPLAVIVEAVKRTLERTPPELASDIIDRGMVLTGGGALLRGIDQYLTRETGIPAFLADDPVGATALGASRALERLSALQKSVPDLIQSNLCPESSHTKGVCPCPKPPLVLLPLLVNLNFKK